MQLPFAVHRASGRTRFDMYVKLAGVNSKRLFSADLVGNTLLVHAVGAAFRPILLSPHAAVSCEGV